MVDLRKHRYTDSQTDSGQAGAQTQGWAHVREEGRKDDRQTKEQENQYSPDIWLMSALIVLQPAWLTTVTAVTGLTAGTFRIG